MLESPSLLRPEQRQTQVEQLLEGEPRRLPAGQDRPLQIGSEERQAQQLTVIRRGRDRVDHRPAGRIVPEQRVRRAQRPDQHRVRPGRRVGRAEDPGPPAVQPHAQRQDQAKLRGILAIRRERLRPREGGSVQVCNGPAGSSS